MGAKARHRPRRHYEGQGPTVLGLLKACGQTPGGAAPRRIWPVLIVLCAGIAVTVAVSGLFWRADRWQAAIEMEARLHSRTLTLQAELHRYEDLVSAVKAYVEGNTGRFNAREFDDVVLGLLHDRAGIYALAYVARIPLAERAAYEASVRKAGFLGFTITERLPDHRLVPAGKRDEYFVVHSTVPLRGNERALGFDMGPERHALLMRAADTGRMIASGPVRLVVRPHDAADGILMIAPIYAAPEATLASAQERRARLVGFALGVFEIPAMIESILDTTTVPVGFDHYVFDGASARPDRLIAVHSSRLRKPGAAVPSYDQVRARAHFSRLSLADRSWTIATVPLADPSAIGSGLDALAVLLAGLFGTGAGSLYLCMTLRRAAELETLNRRLETSAAALQREVGERKKAGDEILRLAREDSLTGLPNRRVFVEALRHAIARARRGESFAVLYLDLDHFKDVNDTLGHPVGDLLLRAAGARIKAHLRETDAVARFGGDEFAVLMTHLGDAADAAVLADALVAIMAAPFPIEGKEIRTGASVGVAVYGPDSPDAEALLSHADIALYRAKSEGRGVYRFFTAAMDIEVRARVRLDGELNRAVAAGEFFLLYQPQIDIATGRITAVEALLRWRHPERGVLAPEDFLAAAEKNGVVTALTRFTLAEACRTAKAWLAAGLAPPSVAVNLSPVCFKRPLVLERDIENALAGAGLAPGKLAIELSESALMEVSREHNDVIAALRRKGVGLAIDAFGTGYSSLDYLRRFPVDRIKIARRFITGLVGSPGHAVIVRAAIGLASALGIGAVAVGVETEDQLRLLRAMGCKEAQGFLVAAPMAADDMARLLARGSAPEGERRTQPLATIAAS
jgi:diguanylate cyclase (GGDEF)-like protein